MSPLRRRLAALLLVPLLALPAAAQAPAPPDGVGEASSRPAGPPTMFNAIGDIGAWRSYRSRFVTPEGRVVDTGNGRISHSEGQGYGMLLAVAAGDRDAFQRIWGWTRANLMVRPDALLAWRWEPDKRPGVADVNDATDGDILVAWALAEAAEAWSDEGYRLAGRRIAVDVARRTVLFKAEGGPLLLPAIAGFSAEDRADGPVVNLSYWVFPAFPRLAALAPEFDWGRLNTVGLDLMTRARFGTSRLPTEWIAMRGGVPKPAEGFPATFSYNAVRVPLYLAMAGYEDRKAYEPFVKLWSASGSAGMPILDINSDQTVGQLQEPGYAAVAALAACAGTGAALPPSFAEPAVSENYYPATLHLLALAAANTRYRSCLGR
ncbi:glycosyl hydrolase family 8 [Methylobacterium sp. E-025]|uniref:glycosyl hydrolase family 8 n=1 Tax=Methylobacterium sp. E-025 TaxID=2836561 RepID=UPI001FB9E93F|nr:glycosyl hydrolase family 8 [Methylobacterium sp. E-025]MCJ2114749.1 glycosyl hydrolase family 8 [Methylobacterium sp. E-025]